ncbi:MAG: NAD-dependent epimerase, partial [Flavobacteriaceae bacterium]|nr:NAD-dependent epimerase [Flavobacteriaceae bacterium]
SPQNKASKNLMTLALFLDAIRSFFLNKRRRLSSAIIKSSHSKNEYSNKKITTTLNYKFIKIEKSIKETCKNYKLN